MVQEIVDLELCFRKGHLFATEFIFEFDKFILELYPSFSLVIEIGLEFLLGLSELMALISSMILANATVIICSQFVLLKMMSALSLTQRVQIGLVLLALSQAWMAMNPVSFFIMFLLSHPVSS